MKINEENFIKQIKLKNEKALDYVIENYVGLVKAIVKKHLNVSEELQEECLNDIFLAIWYGIENYDSNKNTFKNWIAAIAKFKSIDYQRKYYRNLIEQSIEKVELISSTTLEEEILKNELDEKLDVILQDLKPIEREIFLDYYIKDKEVKTIAKDTNFNINAIYNKLSRTRKKIKNQYIKILCGGK